MEVQSIVENQRSYFCTDATKPIEFRLNALKRLKSSIQKNEQRIFDALRADLNKSDFESYMAEVGLVLDELGYAIKNLRKWSKPRRVKTPLAQFPSKSFVVSDPYGIVLVMSPWNYPFYLTLAPLVGAIAAGNCAVIKPSDYSKNTSGVIADIIHECFSPDYMEVVLGGRQQNADLLQQKFDYIFFTGGTTVGRLVLQSAIPNVTPVTLELGGKSPCIVDQSADIKLAAKRIVFGKFLNAGQTCVAPDYILVHSSKKEQLAANLISAIQKAYTQTPLTNPSYPRIVNQKHFDRLLGLIRNETVVCGGKSNADTLQIEPTILSGITWESPIMQDEIFGPILPLLAFDTIDEVIHIVNAHPKPLALYLFTIDPDAEQKILTSVSFGGGCINDTLIHLATHCMPFGGVGFSGMGSYHGKQSFDTFAHYKGIVKKSTRIDLPMRYQPSSTKQFKAIRKFIH